METAATIDARLSRAGVVISLQTQQSVLRSVETESRPEGSNVMTGTTGMGTDAMSARSNMAGTALWTLLRSARLSVAMESLLKMLGKSAMT